MAPVSEAAFEDLRERVSNVEKVQAVTVERSTSIDRRLSVIEANSSRILWAIGLGIGGYAISFVIRGGLNVPL